MAKITPTDQLFPALRGSDALPDPTTERGREVCLARAYAAGKIAARSIPVWRRRLEEQPEFEAAELENLGAVVTPPQDVFDRFPNLREAGR